MKKLLSILVASFCIFSANKIIAQTSPITTAQTASPVSFQTTKHSFGKIKQGEPQTFVFNLKNNGNKPLIIENATAQCGCTKPEYPNKPIAKGKSSTISVTYNAATLGAFTKTVTVKFLGINEPTILTIDGEVIKSPESKKN